MKSTAAGTGTGTPTKATVAGLARFSFMLLLLLVSWMYDEEGGGILGNLWLVAQIVFHAAIYVQGLTHVFRALAHSSGRRGQLLLLLVMQ